MHIGDGQAEGRNTIRSKSSLLPHTDLQGIVSSSLTPDLNSLVLPVQLLTKKEVNLGRQLLVDMIWHMSL